MTFGSSFGRVFSPTFHPKSQAKVGGDWWLAGGISPANCIIAYQPKGAASYEASLVNLANPGTYNAAEGNAPSFAASTGWSFNGTSHYLKTNYVPSAGANLSIIVRVNGAAPQAGSRTVMGQHAASSPYNGVFLRLQSVSGTIKEALYANDGLSAPKLSNRSGDHVICVAGRQGYYDGNADGSAFAESTGAFGNYDLVMGALQYSSIVQHYNCSIYAVAIYIAAITAAQVDALTTAMNLL